MLPILFSIGAFNLYTLGLMFGLGYLLAAFIIWRRLKELSLKEEKVIDFIIVGGVALLFWARLFYIVQNLAEFNFSLGKWVNFNRFPGFSYFGAVFGVTITLFWVARKLKWDFWQIGDEIVFGVLPLMVLAQVGCFLDGSGQGKPTTMPWGIFFPGSLLRRQPLAAFTALIVFLIWIFLLRIEREWRFWEWYKSKANGLILLVFWGLFFASNILLAFLKDSKIYFFLLDLVGSLLGLLVVAVVFYIRSGRKIVIYEKK